jgi:hypothetical protein
VSFLIFGFRDTISEEVALGLHAFGDVVVLDSSVDTIEAFVANIHAEKYQGILGLGSYSGMGSSELRIETTCTSQFRNDTEPLQKKRIPFFFKSSARLRLTNGIGNSWCNLLSYKIVTAFPDKPFTFLHIPSAFQPSEAIDIISRQLLDS